MPSTAVRPESTGASVKNALLAGLPSASVTCNCTWKLVSAPDSLLLMSSVPEKAERVSVTVWSIWSVIDAQTCESLTSVMNVLISANVWATGSE